MSSIFVGGLLNRSITEIAGESASGKTQLCMQLCLAVQLPEAMHGLNSGNTCVYYLNLLLLMVFSLDLSTLETSNGSGFP